jgi:membrane protein
MRTRWRSFRGIVDLWVDLFAEHNLLTYASAIALQALIAAVAIALLLVGALGALHHESVWTDTIAPAIQPRLLTAVYAGIAQVVDEIFASSSAGLVTFAAALAVWEVSGVVRAVMGSLNEVYDTEETRPWWLRFPISFALAIVLLAALLGALVLVWAVHGHGAWGWPVGIARWLGAVVLIVVAFGVLVRFSPDKHRAKRWVSAGAILVVVAWIVESLIFRWYVASVANFKTAPGSLLVVLVFSSYFYVASIILLVAIELDELVRRDAELSRREQRLLPLVAGVLRGT